VELRQRDLGEAVEPDRVPQHHGVEPAGAPASTGVGAELVASLDEQLTLLVEQLGRERPRADARHVRFGDPDDALDVAWADAGARASASRTRVRRRDERIRALVEVEERG